jgi:hypothetical protein
MNLSPEKLASLLQSIAAFNVALKTQLGLKLGKNEVAADTTLFEGKTLAEITGAINAATALEIDALELIINNFIARRDNPHQVTAAQVGLGLVANFGTASSVEAAAGIASDKNVTPAGLAAFWAGKVGAAPETLDTIAEIAAALQGNPDVITELLTAVGGKLGKTEKAADTSLFDGKTLAQVIAEAQAGVDLSQVVLKGDDFASYKVGAQTFTEIFAGIQSDLDAVEALIPLKASTEEAVAGVEDSKWVTSVGVKAATAAAIAALVDGAPEALDTLNELAVKLADQDDAVAAIVSSLSEKLGKLETAADSAKFGGKTLAQFIADADVATKLITDPLAARIAALEGITGGDTDFLTAESDLGVNPVALATDGVEAPKSLKAHLEGVNADLVSGVAAVEAAQAAADAAQADADAAGVVAAQGVADAATADGKAVAAQTAADAAQVAADAALAAAEAAQLTADGKLDVDGVAVNSSLLEGQSLAQILSTIRGGDIQTIQAVQDALDAYIDSAEAGALQKASSAEAVAGTDDAKYITALALKAKVDAAISALVDGAPTALDTLKELADALANSDDAIAALTLVIDGKLGKTEQAVDSLRLNGKTQAELTASGAELTTGTATDKFLTPAVVAPRLAALEAGQTGSNADLELLVDEMTAAFNSAAADIDPA